MVLKGLRVHVWGGVVLCLFSSDSSCQLDVLGHDCYLLCVYGAKVCVFKETHQVSLSSFLQCHNSACCESWSTILWSKIQCYLSYNTLERQFSDKEFSRFLVSPYFSEGHSARSVSMWLFDPSSGGHCLSCCLHCFYGLRVRLFSTLISFSCLLCSRHFNSQFDVIALMVLFRMGTSRPNFCKLISDSCSALY